MQVSGNMNPHFPWRYYLPCPSYLWTIACIYRFICTPVNMQHPPPYLYRPGRRAERGRRGYAPRGGGGGGSAKRPWQHQQPSVRGGEGFKRGRGHPDPPPPRREAGASGAT